MTVTFICKTIIKLSPGLLLNNNDLLIIYIKYNKYKCNIVDDIN